MPRDPDVLRARLRLDTAKMLGVDLENMTASQEVRLARACMLRLELDDIESRKLNNQPFDVKAYVIASESLERLLGGRPDQPETGPDFTGAKEELARFFAGRASAIERRDQRRELEMVANPGRARAEAYAEFEERLARAIAKHSKTIPDPGGGDDVERDRSVVSLSEPSLSAAARSESASEHPVLIEPPPAPPPAPRKTLAEINVPVNPPREPSPWTRASVKMCA
jgi:hypothetical protein